RTDGVWQTSVSPWYENIIRWGDSFRTTVGLRADLFHFDVASSNPVNSGSETDAIVSPKAGIVLGPWVKTELYVNGGLGFHSNDGRGVTSRIDPVTGDPVDPADPLVRTYGAEV